MIKSTIVFYKYDMYDCACQTEPCLSLLLSPETLMDSTTATAELGWTVYPVSGSSDNSVSNMLHFHSSLLLIMRPNLIFM